MDFPISKSQNEWIILMNISNVLKILVFCCSSSSGIYSQYSMGGNDYYNVSTGQHIGRHNIFTLNNNHNIPWWTLKSCMYHNERCQDYKFSSYCSSKKKQFLNQVVLVEKTYSASQRA